MVNSTHEVEPYHVQESETLRFWAHTGIPEMQPSAGPIDESQTSALYNLGAALVCGKVHHPKALLPTVELCDRNILQRHHMSPPAWFLPMSELPVDSHRPPSESLRRSVRRYMDDQIGCLAE